jgi:hypothetical protein
MEDCKGCYTKATCDEAFRLPPIERARSKCPCRICLVKGVCNERCEYYRVFWNSKDIYTLPKTLDHHILYR